MYIPPRLHVNRVIFRVALEGVLMMNIFAMRVFVFSLLNTIIYCYSGMENIVYTGNVGVTLCLVYTVHREMR